MIGWGYHKIPHHVVVRWRECGVPATMQDPFILVHGKGAREVLADPHMPSVQAGGAAIIERYRDALNWREAHGRRFYLGNDAVGVVTFANCVSRYSHTLSWPGREGENLDYPVFGEYLNNVRALPTGTERLECSRAALRRYDERLVPINLEYRERIIDACFDIIERHTVG